MAKKITELPAAASLTASDVIAVVAVAGPTTQKATVAVLRVAILPASLTTEVSGVLPVANGGTGSAALPTGGFAGLTAMAFGDAAAESNASTYTGTAITAERTAVRTLTSASISGASNTLTVRIANDVTGLGTGVATFLAAPSGANLASALTTALPVSKGGTGVTALTIPASALLVGTTDAQTLTAKTLTDPIINAQKHGSAIAVGALAIDWTLGTVFTKTLAAGANTITWSNQASGMVIVVRVTGAASTLIWPTVKWSGGAAPVQTASGTDVYTFVHDGVSVYGSAVQAMA